MHTGLPVWGGSPCCHRFCAEGVTVTQTTSPPHCYLPELCTMFWRVCCQLVTSSAHGWKTWWREGGCPVRMGLTISGSSERCFEVEARGTSQLWSGEDCITGVGTLWWSSGPLNVMWIPSHSLSFRGWSKSAGPPGDLCPTGVHTAHHPALGTETSEQSPNWAGMALEVHRWVYYGGCFGERRAQGHVAAFHGGPVGLLLQVPGS